MTSIRSRDEVKNSKASKMIHSFLKNHEVVDETGEAFSKTKAEVRFFYVFRTTENKSHTLLLSYTGQRGYYYSTEAFEEYIEEKSNTLRE